MTALKTFSSFLRVLLRVVWKIPKNSFIVNCGRIEDFSLNSVRVHLLHYPGRLLKAQKAADLNPRILARILPEHARGNSRASAVAVSDVCELVALVRPTRHILLRLLSGDNTRHFCVAPVGYRTQALRLLFPLLLPVASFFFFYSNSTRPAQACLLL